MSENEAVDIGTGKPVVAGSNGGGNYGERLARIEARLDSIERHGATKNDISQVKIWFLVGVIAAIGVAVPAAIGVAFAAVRLFTP